jgi:hypothetical protein
MARVCGCTLGHQARAIGVLLLVLLLLLSKTTETDGVGLDEYLGSCGGP